MPGLTNGQHTDLAQQVPHIIFHRLYRPVLSNGLRSWVPAAPPTTPDAGYVHVNLGFTDQEGRGEIRLLSAEFACRVDAESDCPDATGGGEFDEAAKMRVVETIEECLEANGLGSNELWRLVAIAVRVANAAVRPQATSRENWRRGIEYLPLDDEALQGLLETYQATGLPRSVSNDTFPPLIAAPATGINKDTDYLALLDITTNWELGWHNNTWRVGTARAHNC